MLRGSYAGDDWTLRVKEEEARFDLEHRLPGSDGDTYRGEIEYRDGLILLGGTSHETIRGDTGEFESTGYAAWPFVLRAGKSGTLELFAGPSCDGPRLALLRASDGTRTT